MRNFRVRIRPASRFGGAPQNVKHITNHDTNHHGSFHDLLHGYCLTQRTRRRPLWSTDGDYKNIRSFRRAEEMVQVLPVQTKSSHDLHANSDSVLNHFPVVWLKTLHSPSVSKKASCSPIAAKVKRKTASRTKHCGQMTLNNTFSVYRLKAHSCPKLQENFAPTCPCPLDAHTKNQPAPNTAWVPHHKRDVHTYSLHEARLQITRRQGSPVPTPQSATPWRTLSHAPGRFAKQGTRLGALAGRSAISSSCRPSANERSRLGTQSKSRTHSPIPREDHSRRSDVHQRPTRAASALPPRVRASDHTHGPATLSPKSSAPRGCVSSPNPFSHSVQSTCCGLAPPPRANPW